MQRQTEALKWAVALCERKGAAWDVYAGPLRSALDAGPSANYASIPVITSVVRGESLDVMMRYELGRFLYFNGPKSRADKRVLLHEIKLNRPVGTR